MKVLVPYTDEYANSIREIIGSDATVVRSSRDIDSMIEHGGDATVIASGRVPGEYIHSAPNLRLIQTFGVGINSIDRDAVLERGDITVCNSHLNASEVAEYTISLLFAAAKNLAMNDREMRRGDWSLRYGGPIYNVELRNKTCLLVGLGAIGLEIAKRLRVFGIQVHAVTRTGVIREEGIANQISPIDQIHKSIPEADFVILALPLTDESMGLVDEKFLNQMKSSSILVNISRGAIVDEAALFSALKNNQIRAAALDVWWRYPSRDSEGAIYPSEEFPFHELDNMTLSPHRASYSENIERGLVSFAGENILRFIRGAIPLNMVDMKNGY
ncbi:MAG: 2-hydroxyacid dehydrogenase [Candidatus Thorarchaeota archaeon]